MTHRTIPRSVPSSRKVVVSTGIHIGPLFTSMAGCRLSLVRCVIPGTARCSSDKMALTTPTRPEAVSVWPMQDFPAPITRGLSPVWDPSKTWLTPCISIKSPSLVPVPCASIKLFQNLKPKQNVELERSLDF